MKRSTERKNSISDLAVLLTLAVFAFCVIAVLFAGTESYRGIAERGQETYEARTCSQYIFARIRQIGEGDRISTAAFGDGDALVLDQVIEGESYRTLIYCSSGWLMEYFADAEAIDMENDAELGSRLVPADDLRVKLEKSLNGSLLTAEIDLNGETSTVKLHLRSGEEAGYEE